MEYFHISVNLKRSKSAPGLVEASCRLPFNAPVRRTGSEFHRLSCVKESDVSAILPSSSSSTDEQAQPLQQQQQQCSSSSNSLLAVAPLASSISVTSSLKSARQPIINHSISWSTTTDARKSDTTHVGRTISLMNNNDPSTVMRSNSTDVNNEIEQLKQRLTELEQQEETFVFDSASEREYRQLQTRLKSLEDKQFHSRR